MLLCFVLLLALYSPVLGVTSLGSSEFWNDTYICDITDWTFQDTDDDHFNVDGPNRPYGHNTCLYGPWGSENDWIERTFSTSITGDITMNIRTRFFTGCSPDDDEFCYISVDYHDSTGYHGIFNDSRTGESIYCNGYYNDWVELSDNTGWPICDLAGRPTCYQDLSLVTPSFSTGQITIRFGCPLSASRHKEYWAISNFYLNILTQNPTQNPSKAPSKYPTVNPTNNPSYSPTLIPSKTPTINPSEYPSDSPSNYPSNEPSKYPSMSPTNNPSIFPTQNPSLNPSKYPSKIPSHVPTLNPSKSPSNEPSNNPTTIPSSVTNDPSMKPTSLPTSLDSKKVKRNNLNDELLLYLILPSGVICIILLCIICILCYKSKRTESDENLGRINSNSEVQIQINAINNSNNNMNKIPIPPQSPNSINMITPKMDNINDSNNSNYSNKSPLNSLLLKPDDSTKGKIQNGEKSNLHIRKESFSSENSDTEFQAEGMYHQNKSTLTFNINDNNVITPIGPETKGFLKESMTCEKEDSLFGKKVTTQQFRKDSENTQN